MTWHVSPEEWLLDFTSVPRSRLRAESLDAIDDRLRLMLAPPAPQPALIMPSITGAARPSARPLVPPPARAGVPEPGRSNEPSRPVPEARSVRAGAPEPGRVGELSRPIPEARSTESETPAARPAETGLVMPQLSSEPREPGPSVLDVQLIPLSSPPAPASAAGMVIPTLTRHGFEVDVDEDEASALGRLDPVSGPELGIPADDADDLMSAMAASTPMLAPSQPEEVLEEPEVVEEHELEAESLDDIEPVRLSQASSERTPPVEEPAAPPEKFVERPTTQPEKVAPPSVVEKPLPVAEKPTLALEKPTPPRPPPVAEKPAPPPPPTLEKPASPPIAEKPAPPPPPTLEKPAPPPAAEKPAPPPPPTLEKPTPPPPPAEKAGPPSPPSKPATVPPPLAKSAPGKAVPPPVSPVPAAATAAPASAAGRKRNWFDEAFGEHYGSITPLDADASAEIDAAFIRKSAELGAGQSLLDVGCGDGRHCFALANLGLMVSGLDCSLAQLVRASQRNEATEAGVTLLHGDMRALPRDRQYDAVTCLGSTLGYFESEEQNRQCVQELVEVVRPGGKLVLQVFNRDYLVAVLPCRSWWQGRGCLVLDVADMNYFTNRVRIHRTIVFEDGRQFEHHMYIRAFSLHELGKMLTSQGMRVLEVSGSRDTRGRFYGATSAEIWIVAQRRDDV